MEKTRTFVELVRAAGIRPQRIFDLGAFDGEQTLELGRAFPAAEIYAFECSTPWAAVCSERLTPHPHLHLIPVAVDDQTRLEVFHESIGDNPECGSLLRPNGQYPDPMPTRETVVPVYRLETVIDQVIGEGADLIWMDVQGVELRALKGLGMYLPRLRMFWSEVAFARYYHGQMLVPEFDQAVEELGFKKIGSAIGVPGWFGDGCYQRK